jgi:hypothetical protein
MRPSVYEKSDPECQTDVYGQHDVCIHLTQSVSAPAWVRVSIVSTLEYEGHLLSTDVYGQHDVESKRQARAWLDRTRLGSCRDTSSALVALTIRHCRVLVFSLCCPPAHPSAALPVPPDGCYSCQDSTGAEAFGFRPFFAFMCTHF